MITRHGWAPGIGFGQDPGGEMTPTDTAAGVDWNAILNKVVAAGTDLGTKVAGEAVSGAPAQETVTTSSGQQAGIFLQNGKWVTYDSAGNLIDLTQFGAPAPTTTTSAPTSSGLPDWVLPAAIGGGVLVLLLVVMKR